MPPHLYLKNPEEIKRAFKTLDKLTKTRNLEAAVNAGLQPINNDAQQRAPYLTGTLRRSIHTEILESSDQYCEGASGTNLNYALRLELGFNDTDALGRTYHQPATPYMRPAFDGNKEKAVKEIGASLNDILMKLI